MRVLVAGGAGYIGSHTCKALAAAGHTPIAYDNLHTGHRWAVKWGPFEQGDLNDAAALAATLKKHKPEAVINFAALAYVGESNQEPTLYYRNNVAGMVSLLEAMRAHDVANIVFSSSCATYGVPARLPITEDMPQNPINPYGRTKLVGEMMLRDACAAYGVAAVALRYFNAAGADAGGEIGEEHDPETHLIPLVLQAAAGKIAKISIFGTDYPTEDGTCIRDYIHVTDLAAAHVAALTACRPGKFAAYNLGTGTGASIEEVLGCARQITRKPIPAAKEGRRPGDPPVLVADPSLARSALKWTPVHSSLDNIVSTAWAWMTEHRARAVK
jgi:UDP-arabinose 4-epimerase